MSDIFHNFDSNGAGDDTQDIMASPSQISPMANSNSSLAGASNVTVTNVQNSNNSTPGAAAVNNAKIAGGNLDNQPVVTKPRLMELVREVDITAQLDEDVEELLLQIADDFVEDTVKTTCTYARHRKVPKVEVRDVQLHLERKWNMWLPGFGTDELRPYKRAAITEAHKQRLALIRKTIKKY